MIDTSYWHPDDPAWIAQRNITWPIFTQWMDESKNWIGDFDIGEQKQACLQYFFTGGIAGERLMSWTWFLLMHPEPSVCNIRKLVLSMCDKNISGAYANRGGYSFFIGLAEPYNELVIRKFLTQKELGNIIQALSGQDYAENAKIWEFDPSKKIGVAVDKILPRLNLWLKYPNPSELPIELLVSHVKSFLTFITPETWAAAEFSLNFFCRNLGRYRPLTKEQSDNVELQISVAKDMQSYLLSDAVHPCVNELAKQYIHIE